MACGMWGIQPSEFWGMTPTEFWHIFEQKHGQPKFHGSMTEDDVQELYEMIT